MGNLKIGSLSVIGGNDCHCPLGECTPSTPANIGTVVCRESKKKNVAPSKANAEDQLAAQPDTSNFSAASSGYVNDLPNIARFAGKQ